MPRQRKQENKGLPLGWRTHHNAYYYDVPKGQESAWDGKRFFRLGKSLPDAYRVWADRIDRPLDAKTISDLLDMYLIRAVPEKDVTSHATNASFIRNLKSVFGEMKLTALRPMHCYQYIEGRRVKYIDEITGKVRGGLTVAQREIELLSHAFTKAVEWGLIDAHPFKGEIRISGNKPRDRYVEDWEIEECMKLTSPQKKGSVKAIQAYILLKIMTSMDRGDILRLTMSDLKEDGIHNQRGKVAGSTGKRTIYLWTPELREVVDMAKSARPALSSFLFCTRKGTGYYNEANGRADGWKNMWARYMDKLLEKTKVTERFTEHDLRAKAGSDAETLDQAQKLLAHADPATTERIYRRRADQVMPLKGLKKTGA